MPDRRCHMTFEARKLGRAHRWRLARLAASSVTPAELRCWFGDIFGEGERLPAHPARRMLWLVEVRAAFSRTRDNQSLQRVDAALWAEAEKLRRHKRLGRKLAATAREPLTDHSLKIPGGIPKKNRPCVIASDTCRSDVVPPFTAPEDAGTDRCGRDAHPTLQGPR